MSRKVEDASIVQAQTSAARVTVDLLDKATAAAFWRYCDAAHLRYCKRGEGCPTCERIRAREAAR